MHTEVGVGQGRKDGGKGLRSNSRVLWGYLSAAVLAVAFAAGGVDRSQASPVQLASYKPAEDFVVLSLKNSSTIAARIPQETFLSRYEVVSNMIETLEPEARPAPHGERRFEREMFVKAAVSQARCLTGGLFDNCPGFVELLESRHKAWPRFAEIPLPPVRGRRVKVASLSDVVNETRDLVTVNIVAPVDRLAMRSGAVIIGAASTYNPCDRDDNDAGGAETASGELYNPIAWTAAIQSGLREKFAGVRYGRLYRPSFAVVELNGRRAIVRINDVGPLRPGRVIDLSTQAMHYFDPSLRDGVLDGALVTPLVGTNWTPGPLGNTPMVAVASSDL